MAMIYPRSLNKSSAILLGMLIPALIGIGPDDPSAKTVFSEYQKGLNALAEKFDHCQGEGILSGFSVSKDGTRRENPKSKITFAFSSGKGRQRRSPLDWKDPASNLDSTKKAGTAINYETILGYNDKYSFTLGIPSPNAKPVIETIKPGDKIGRSQIDNSAGYLALSPISIHLVRLSHFVEIPGFRVERVVEVKPSNGNRQLRLEFSMPKKSGLSKGTRPIVEGWLLVSPEEGWLLHEYGTIHSTPNFDQKIFTYVGHVDYQKNSRGEFMPTKSDVRLYRGAFDSDPATSDQSAQAVSGEDFEFTKLEFIDTPASEFTLSGFGLPEYGQTVAQVSATRSRPWWIVGLAVLSGGAAIGLRRLATRNRVAKLDGSLGSGTPSTPGAT